MYGYYGMDWTYIMVLIGAVLCMLASARVNSAYAKYERVRAMSGMTGAQVAQRILEQNGIYDAHEGRQSVRDHLRFPLGCGDRGRGA